MYAFRCGRKRLSCFTSILATWCLSVLLLEGLQLFYARQNIVGLCLVGVKLLHSSLHGVLFWAFWSSLGSAVSGLVRAGAGCAARRC